MEVFHLLIRFYVLALCVIMTCTKVWKTIAIINNVMSVFGCKQDTGRRHHVPVSPQQLSHVSKCPKSKRKNKPEKTTLSDSFITAYNWGGACVRFFFQQKGEEYELHYLCQKIASHGLSFNVMCQCSVNNGRPRGAGSYKQWEDRMRKMVYGGLKWSETLFTGPCLSAPGWLNRSAGLSLTKWKRHREEDRKREIYQYVGMWSS